MIIAALSPFALSAVLWVAAPWVARQGAPRIAARVLVGASLVTALATGLVLCAVAVLAVAELPAAGRYGHWSAARLSSRAPVPDAVGFVVAIVAATLLVASIVFVVRLVRRIVAADRTCRRLGPGSGGLVVLDDDRAGAYAVPGFSGRMVVTSALLRRLDAGERRAVLAHEATHLRHHHYLYVQLAELAAVANPLLRPAARAVRLAVECWADDEAAIEVGDRRVVARALAAAGLAQPTTPVPGLALSVGETDLGCRVRRLVGQQRSGVRSAPGVLAVVALVAAAGALAFAAGAHADFEQAQAAYHWAGRV